MADHQFKVTTQSGDNTSHPNNDNLIQDLTTAKREEPLIRKDKTFR
jgi:hypothetical protein